MWGGGVSSGEQLGSFCVKNGLSTLTQMWPGSEKLPWQLSLIRLFGALIKTKSMLAMEVHSRKSIIWESEAGDLCEFKANSEVPG